MVPSSRPVKWGPAGIALGYSAIAILWIAFSDLAVTRLGLSPVLLTVKGFVFVAVTAYLLYITVRRLIATVQQASRERDETARLYQTVVEASQEGICLLNEAGEISFLNTHLAAMLGRPAKELQGKPLQDFLHGSDSLSLDTNRNSKSQTHEYRLRTGAAGDVWVLITFTPLLDATGAHCGSLAVLVDVTQRKRLEEELRHSQKLEALGSFAGGITHDFNNLLSVMAGYASLLEKSLHSDGQSKQWAREILNACDRGTQLIRQLLAFSRKQTVVTEVVDVCEAVSRFGNVLPRIVGEQIEVRVRCDASTGCVRIGAGQIEQILMNLAANARDAMQRGGALSIKTLTVEVGTSAARAQGVKSGTYVAIQVTDTGTGIDPNVKARIFEPFFTTKPQGAGTGLGLSTVYGIAAQHGGYVTCDSAVGIGTTFIVYLPSTQKSSQRAEPAAPVTCSVAGTETVLLVEDDDALRTLTKHILSSYGYRVLEASNGIEAKTLMQFGDQHVELLLTDIAMPGMSGIELAEAVIRTSPETRIAFMSGHSELPDHLGDKAFVIHKPVAPDALLRDLRQILSTPPRTEA